MTQFLIRHFIKDPEQVQDKAVRKAYGTLGSLTGIACNIFLFIVKLVAGLLSNSLSILADAMNNLSDMGSSIVTMLGFKLSAKPADDEHPFGHGRMEYMSAFIVSVLILLVGFELLQSSIDNILKPEPVTISYITLVILAVSILVKLWMSSFNRKLGRKINSQALTATAQDSVNDALTTAAILLSAMVSFFFRINIDPYMSAAVSLFILYSGLKTAKETLDPLLGQPPDPALIDAIENEIMHFGDFVGIHDLIVHNYGPGRCFASVHVEVPETIDIVRCHEQIDLCEKLVAERLDVSLVIHMDPIAVDDEALNATKAKMAQQIKTIHPDLTLHDFRMTPKSDRRTNLIFDVVVPASLHMPPKQLQAQIDALAKQIDPSYCCVVTLDANFTGRR